MFSVCLVFQVFLQEYVCWANMIRTLRYTLVPNMCNYDPWETGRGLLRAIWLVVLWSTRGISWLSRSKHTSIAKTNSVCNLRTLLYFTKNGLNSVYTCSKLYRTGLCLRGWRVKQMRTRRGGNINKIQWAQQDGTGKYTMQWVLFVWWGGTTYWRYHGGDPAVNTFCATGRHINCMDIFRYHSGRGPLPEVTLDRCRC